MQPHAVVAECAIAITASEACTAGAWPHAVQASVSSFRNETIAPTLSTTQARNGSDKEGKFHQRSTKRHIHFNSLK
jgi:hypothetical protein